MTTTIDQWDAPQLARHACNVFLFWGRHQAGARLIYRALALDPHQAAALRCLSDLLDVEGTEVFAGVVLEYALEASTGLTDEERQELDDLRFFSKWTWGFARHQSGEPHLAQEAFADRSAFAVDEERYTAFLNQMLARAGSLAQGFQSALTLCGVLAGFVVHTERGDQVGIGELLHPERLQLTATYDEWLRSSTEDLDALEAERQQQALESDNPQ